MAGKRDDIRDWDGRARRVHDTVAALAALCCACVRRLEQYFHDTLPLCPHRRLQAVRMEAARSFL